MNFNKYWNSSRDDFSNRPSILFQEEHINYITSECNKVIDLGCGNGILTKKLNDFGVETFGITYNIEEVKRFIDSMALIDTLENHSSFLEKLNYLIYDTYGFYSFSNKNAINENFKTLEISNAIKTRIEELNSFDMEVYDYVKSTR